MAYDKAKGWWEKDQAEKAKHVVIDREKMRFRYVDPNTGQYREMDEAEITAFQQHEQEKMIERIERERRDQENDAERYRRRYQQQEARYDTGNEKWNEARALGAKLGSDREEIKHQLYLATERQDEAAAVYWMDQLVRLDNPMRGMDGVPVEFKKQTTETKKMVPLHKAGHFPTQWMREAVERAEASDMCVTLTVEKEGVLVTAIEADDRFDIRVTTWEAMEQNHVNPLLEAIDAAERKIKVLERLKARVQS